MEAGTATSPFLPFISNGAIGQLEVNSFWGVKMEARACNGFCAKRTPRFVNSRCEALQYSSRALALLPSRALRGYWISRCPNR